MARVDCHGRSNTITPTATTTITITVIDTITTTTTAQLVLKIFPVCFYFLNICGLNQYKSEDMANAVIVSPRYRFFIKYVQQKLPHTHRCANVLYTRFGL